MKRLTIAAFCILAASFCLAQNPGPKVDVETVEIKLVDPLDETRGWCVDLFAHLTHAYPLGGFQGHDCFLYFGHGPQIDQGFVEALIPESEFRLPYWDVCMTLQEPKHHSFVGAEPCDGSPAQKITMFEDGTIKPDMAQDLCLTLGSISIPGGGRLAPVGARPPANNEDIPLIRKLRFDTCSNAPEIAVLQTWTTRKGEFVPEERTMPHRFLYED